MLKTIVQLNNDIDIAFRIYIRIIAIRSLKENAEMLA